MSPPTCPTCARSEPGVCDTSAKPRPDVDSIVSLETRIKQLLVPHGDLVDRLFDKGLTEGEWRELGYVRELLDIYEMRCEWLYGPSPAQVALADVTKRLEAVNASVKRSSDEVARLDERAAIVAWIRKVGRVLAEDIRPADAREVEDCNLVVIAMNEIADGIAQGKHLPMNNLGKTSRF